MTVAVNDTIERYVITGVGPYAYTWRIFNDTDLVVTAQSTASPPVIVPLTYLTHYTVAGANESAGGSITLTAAAFAAYPGYTLDIRSSTPRNQPTSIRNQARFLPEIHEDAFDYLDRQIQDLGRLVDASVRAPDYEQTLAMVLPPVATRASKFAAYDINGQPIVSAGTGADAGLRTDLAATTLSSDGSRLVGYRYPTASAVARSVSGALLALGISVMDFGAIGNGVADDTAAIQAAINFAGSVVSTPGVPVLVPFGNYKTTAAITFPSQAGPIKLYGRKGSTITCAHNGDGIVLVSQNENFGGHIIDGLTINGPNTFLPAPAYVPPSTGAGISMHRGVGDTTNAVTSYNAILRDVTIQGFKYGLSMSCAIGTNVFGGFLQYNQHGVYVDGGQTNANHFFGTHIRYNRLRGITSTGRSGGSLSAATANVFHGCLLESNIDYQSGFPAGGTPPTNNTAIYLNNSYDWVFRDCYSENHSASIYLTGQSKSNQFKNHRLAPGGGNTRLDAIFLVGTGVYGNDFELKGTALALTDVMVSSDNTDQLYNTFSGEGINFIAGSITAKLDYANVKPNASLGTTGIGVIRRPSWGYAPNISSGTGPAQINGIGTAAATLNVAGFGEIQIGNGLTADTTITTITGALPGQILVLKCVQTAFNCRIQATATNGALAIRGVAAGSSINLADAVGGRTLIFAVDGAGNLQGIPLNFEIPAGTYTVTHASADRGLDVTVDTLAQGLAVLGTLIADLQTKGIIN